MGPSELCYIMEDVLQKLEHIVFKNKRQSPLAKIKYNDIVGFNNLALIPTKTVIKNFIKLLPFLCIDLEILSEFFKVIQNFKQFNNYVNNNNFIFLEFINC